MTEKGARRTWVWVLVGLLVVVVIGFAVLLGLGMMVVTRNMQVTEAGRESAERAIDDARARFAGQVPLVTLDGDGHDARLSRTELDRRIAAHQGPPPESMWIMAWDPDEQRLIKLSVPFWLLRMSPNSNLTVDLPGIGKSRSDLKIDELERAGPGLFLDSTVEGAMILVWTE